jgi:hypothetical protein
MIKKEPLAKKGSKSMNWEENLSPFSRKNINQY